MVCACFDGLRIENLSFFTSKFHIRNTAISVVGETTGYVDIEVQGSKIIIDNSITGVGADPEFFIVLKNKYDHTQVYRSFKFTEPKRIIIEDHNFDTSLVEFDTLKISKNFITLRGK